MTTHLTQDWETAECGHHPWDKPFGDEWTTSPAQADCADCLDAIAPDPDDIDSSWDGDTWADVGMTQDENTGVWHA